MADLLPISVRRAQPGDTDAVLDFTRATWDGWDYISLVWRDWLEAADGVLLVATAQPPRPGRPRDLDLFGRPLPPERPIGIARVSLLAEGEAWLEGLRVDPGVRNRGVAGLLHGAALAWAQAQGAACVRYATGQGNQASHRLGTRHGFRLLQAWRNHQPPRDDDIDPDDEATAEPFGHADEPADLADDPAGEVPADVLAAATGAGESREDPDEAPEGILHDVDVRDERAPRTRAGAMRTAADAHRRLRGTGLVVAADAGRAARDELWSLVDGDATFAMGDRLYECRAWTFQELARDRFDAHVRAGEVLVAGPAEVRAPTAGQESAPPGAGRSSAIAIVPLGRRFDADDRPWATLVGDGTAALRIAVAIRAALRRSIRLRLPDDAPLLRGHEEAFAAAGFLPATETLHVLARDLPPDAVIDTGPFGALVFEDAPSRVAVPPPLA